MSSFLMDMQSLSNLANWFYFENNTHGTFKMCKKNILDFLQGHKIKHTQENWDKVFAELLYKNNCYALNQRYGDDLNKFPEFEYKDPKKINIFQVLKSVQCWLYQCAEGDAEKKPIYKLMQDIEKILLNTIVSGLEGYKEAKWN
ncbi:MAG: hypothetical protein ACOC1P_02815 [Minisyncoccales bacterium]